MVSKTAWQILHNTQNTDKQEYEAVVVSDDSDNEHTGKDPKNTHRVKLRIRGLHDGVEDKDLPWASKAQLRAGGGGTGESGVPPKGTKVRVTMRDNSPYYPEYSAAPSTEDTILDEEFKSEYGNVEGHVDAAGNKVSQQTREGNNVYTHHHASGTIIQIADDGTITITGATNVTVSANGNLVLSGKKVTINSQEDLELLSGKEANLSGQEKVTIRSPKINSTVPVDPGAPGPTAPGSPGSTTARSRPKPNLSV